MIHDVPKVVIGEAVRLDSEVCDLLLLARRGVGVSRPLGDCRLQLLRFGGQYLLARPLERRLLFRTRTLDLSLDASDLVLAFLPSQPKLGVPGGVVLLQLLPIWLIRCTFQHSLHHIEAVEVFLPCLRNFSLLLPERLAFLRELLSALRECALTLIAGECFLQSDLDLLSV